MFVPIDALKPILGSMIASGRSDAPPHPWLGIYSEELRQRVFVTRLAADAPGAAAGVGIGDIIVAVRDKPVAGINDFYRKLWARGAPGVDVSLSLLRLNGRLETLSLRSRDRYNWYRYGTGNQPTSYSSRSISLTGSVRIRATWVSESARTRSRHMARASRGTPYRMLAVSDEPRPLLTEPASYTDGYPPGRGPYQAISRPTANHHRDRETRPLPHFPSPTADHSGRATGRYVRQIRHR